MVRIVSSSKLEKILAKAYHQKCLSKAEMLFLLGLREKEKITRLFHVAQNLRWRYFGNKVFLYGFLYFSTYCRNYCNFCSYRAPNMSIRRYRKTESEIMKVALRLTESGVHLIDLTMGEDPFYYHKYTKLKHLVGLVGKIKRKTGLPVMVSPGVIPERILLAFADAGVDWYACYQETHNRRLFHRLRPNQSYDKRLGRKYLARELGLLVEEGILTGVGESGVDIVRSMEAMQDIDAHQVRVMSFNPQECTPMEGMLSPPRIREMIIIAVLRLLFPHRLIPASLDVDGLGGLQRRLEAGANVITSLIPPHTGLAGVSQASLDIDEGYRTVKGILPVLKRAGLRAASRKEYIHWVNNEKNRLIKKDICQGEIKV